MKKTVILMLAASLIAAGCGKLEKGFAGSRGSAIRPDVGAMLMSKGVTVTTDNLGTFRTVAVTGPYIDHTISETEQQPGGVYFSAFVKKNGSEWGFYDTSDATTPTEHYWINGNDIVFWSWYPHDAAGLSVASTPVAPPTAGYGTLAFSYSLPEADPVAKADASAQKDLVFAGNVESRTFQDGTDDITAAVSNGGTHANNEYYSIVFHHALSKIQFGVNVTDNSFNKSLEVKSIKLSGVSSSGDCGFTAPSTFSWKNQTGGGAYEQTYGADFSACAGATGDAPEGWTYNSSTGLYICDNAFFLIPQDVAANTVQMSITFDLGGTEITKTAALPAGSWAPDHYYVYKIAAQGGSDNILLDISLYDWAKRDNYIPIG